MTALFDRLADGPALLSLLERCNAAVNQAYYDPKPAQALARDPEAAAILPLFGGRCERRQTPAHLGRPATYELWRVQQPFPYFWTALTDDLATAIVAKAQADGLLIQDLSAQSAYQIWLRTRDAVFPSDRHSEIRPAEDAAPLHLAAALATLPGAPWTIADDGARLARTLPAWPARLPAAIHPLKVELKSGLLADVVCWAALPSESYDNPGPLAEIVFLSLVGPHKKLKAVWAALMDNKRDQIKLPFLQRSPYGPETKYLGARRLEGKGRYRTFWNSEPLRLEGKGRYRTFWNSEPLPESGMAHVVVECAQATRPQVGTPFPHIVGADGAPHLARFFQQLDLALRLPLDPAWAQTLWDAALTADTAAQRPQLIVPLPAHGCRVYWVRADQDAQWAKLVARCAGATGAHAGAIETIGELKRVSNVTEAPSETDAE